MSIESLMPSNHHILYRLLLLLPSIFPNIRVFSNESVLCIRWPKKWSFNFSLSPSKEYSRLISFRIDWLGLLSVQGTLKSLLQHHSSKASILQCSAFFTVQLSHPYRWMVVPKNLSESPKPPVPVNSTSFGKIVFVDVIKLRMSRWDHPGFRDDRQREKKQRSEDRDWSGESRSQGLQAATRSQERSMEWTGPQNLQREPALPTTWSQTSISKTMREYISAILSSPACGTLLQQPGS